MESGPNSQQSRMPSTPSPSGMMNPQGNYPTPPSPHMHSAYKGQSNAIGLPQQMPPYGSQSQQFPQANYPTRPQYPANYGPAAGAQANAPHANQNQYPGRPMPNQGPPHQQYPGGYQPGWNAGAPGQPNMNHIPNKNGPAPPTGSSPRPLNHLKQHLLHKGGYGGSQSPTSPQNFVNGPMHQPMGPPMGQPLGSHQIPPRLQVI